VGVAAEVVQDMGGGAEGFFGIDDPGLFSQHFDQEFEGYRVGQGSGLTYEAKLLLIAIRL